MDEMTPEDAISGTVEAVSMLGLDEIMPALGMSKVLTMIPAMMLTWQDIVNSDCTCDPCERTREMLTALESH